MHVYVLSLLLTIAVSGISSMESIFQSFKGPHGVTMYLHRGRFIFYREYRRGEVVFIRCQERMCAAKGQIYEDPNHPGVAVRLLNIDEYHTHLPQVHI
jgi:hypothetical protein